MSDSGQKFIKRNRPPRVHISYQDPYEANKQVEMIVRPGPGGGREVPVKPIPRRKTLATADDRVSGAGHLQPIARCARPLPLD